VRIGGTQVALSRRFRAFAALLWPQHAAANGVAYPGAARGLETQARAGVLRALAQAAQRNLGAEHERWLPWCVVAFGAGIAVYFALQTEPSLLLAGLVGAAASFCAWGRPRGAGTALRFLCAMIAAGGLGFAAAKLRTLRIDAPVIARDMGPVRLTGRIESVDIRSDKRARIVLAPSTLGNGKTALPDRLRLTLMGAKAVAAAQPGAVVSALAVLRPPPEPAMPHGYDFARWAYFHRIGGVGFTYGAPKPLEEAPPPGLLDSVRAQVENLRLAMTRRVTAAIPGADGNIAAALITGERGEIDEDDNQAYRDSGLAHVLSISGVHLALAGLGIFWAFRALLALWPWLALTQPIKKWAAIAAFASSSFYLAISGGGSPAVRSYLMLSMMLLGVLADRPALSMRAVALAALALLAYEPEDIVDPSFQMSFAAVIGLIALAEWGASIARNDTPAPSRIAFLWRKGRRYVLGMMLASTVATLATTPFAIYHFDRAAAYSLLANFLAEPVVAFVIMPFAAIAVILMPAGLEAAPLHLMGWGVHVMTAIAHWVADLPGATTLVRAWPPAALVAIVFGGLWIALWRRRWRWLGLAPIAMALSAIFATAPPDLFIARDGQSMAVRGTDGALVVLAAKPDEYTAEQWLLRDGDRRDVAAARADAHCDELGCVAKAKDGRVVALSLHAGALADDCARAKVVVSAVPVRTPCKGPDLVLDRFDVARDGAVAVTFGANGIAVETVAAMRGKRPWSVRANNEGAKSP
jgi:competence protein ComEC